MQIGMDSIHHTRQLTGIAFSRQSELPTEDLVPKLSASCLNVATMNDAVHKQDNFSISSPA